VSISDALAAVDASEGIVGRYIFFGFDFLFIFCKGVFETVIGGLLAGLFGLYW
jgi:hypothetical protein